MFSSKTVIPDSRRKTPKIDKQAQYNSFKIACTVLNRDHPGREKIKTIWENALFLGKGNKLSVF